MLKKRQLLQKRLRTREDSLNANLVGVEDPEAERRLGCDDGRDDHCHHPHGPHGPSTFRRSGALFHILQP